jgi:hypothetical protein
MCIVYIDDAPSAKHKIFPSFNLIELIHMIDYDIAR